MKTGFLPLLLCAAALSAPADGVPAPGAAAPAAQKPARRGLPPEAFTTPTNFLYLVDLSGDVLVGGGEDDFALFPDGWLEGQAAAMQRSLMVGVKAAHGPFKVDDPKESPDPFTLGELTIAWGPRTVARRLFELLPDAKILVILAQGEDLPPVLASPYENWVVMDAGWVKRGGGSPELVRDRMGKRVYQALGACCGAAYHPEREAVMRYSPTPESIDDCLSHNFHPLNANAFSIVARAVGLDPVRLRPRAELVEMGILRPRPKEDPKTQDASPKPASEGPSD